MAISTLKRLLGMQYLRRGDGVLATPDSRRKERLFGESGTGRLSLSSRGMKQIFGPDYDPREDSCIKAFVRLLAAIAEQSHAQDSI